MEGAGSPAGRADAAFPGDGVSAGIRAFAASGAAASGAGRVSAAGTEGGACSRPPCLTTLVRPGPEEQDAVRSSASSTAVDLRAFSFLIPMN